MFRIEHDNGRSTDKAITNDIKDVVQILIGMVNNEKAEQEAYNWCCNAHWGDKYINQEHKFMIQCVYDEYHVHDPKNLKATSKAKCALHNKEIVEKIKKAKRIQESGKIANEFHLRFYDDGIWWLEVERFKSGTTRFWVGFEYKDGSCGASLITPYRGVGTKQFKWAVDGLKLKKAVIDKFESVVLELEKHNLITL